MLTHGKNNTLIVLDFKHRSTIGSLLIDEIFVWSGVAVLAECSSWVRDHRSYYYYLRWPGS